MTSTETVNLTSFEKKLLTLSCKSYLKQLETEAAKVLKDMMVLDNACDTHPDLWEAMESGNNAGDKAALKAAKLRFNDLHDSIYMLKDLVVNLEPLSLLDL